MASIVVRVTRNDFARLDTLTRAKVAAVIAKAALDIEAQAAANAPVKTGFLRSSIHADGAGTEWEVRVGAEYGAFVEFGTRRMAARPYLIPAVEQVRPRLLTALSRLV